jgi:hypothetical protein
MILFLYINIFFVFQNFYTAHINYVIWVDREKNLIKKDVCRIFLKKISSRSRNEYVIHCIDRLMQLT